MSSVTDCDLPAGSLIDTLLPGATYRESFRVPLQRRDMPMHDIFFAVLGHHPGWMKVAILMRNALVRPFGLAAPENSTILSPERRATYRIGDTIGPWPIFALTENELVAGRDNSHLDFRVSFHKDTASAPAKLTISTFCKTHNLAGRLYLAAVLPFHKPGLRHLIAQAAAQGRL